MPKYVNTRTGAVVETASVCSGEDWEEQKESKPQKKTAAKKAAEERKTLHKRSGKGREDR